MRDMGVWIRSVEKRLAELDRRIRTKTGSGGGTGPAGPAGPAGPEGDSAYEIAVANGFVGTEVQWLASLEGDQGPQGIQGIPGDDGAEGPAGPAGPQGPAGEVDVVDGLHARLSASVRGPVKVVMVGSSTTAGVGATTDEDRYVNRFARTLQNAYPSGAESWEPPVRLLADAAAALPVLPGVWVANGGASGTTAASYIDATRRGQIDTFNPHIVVHMVGSNDSALNVVPATFATNLGSQIDQIDALVANVVHVVCDTFPRPDDPDPTYPWSDYIAAMKSVAAARPNVGFAGQADEWVAAGVDGYDPADPFRLTGWRLGAGGDIHPSDSGHLLLAQMITRELRVPPPHFRTQPEVLDRFQRTALGNTETGQTWEQQSGTHVPVDGALTVTAAGNAVVTTGFSDCEVSALVTMSGASVQGLIAKSNDASTRIGAYYNGPSGRMELYAGASLLTWATSGYGLGLAGAEHSLKLRVQGDQIRVVVDGQTIFTYTLSGALTTTYANFRKHGVRCNTTDAAVKWRNFAVRAL